MRYTTMNVAPGSWGAANFAVNLITPWLALACLAIGIVLAQKQALNRRYGAWLVAIGVPVLWPGLGMATFLIHYTSRPENPGYWISVLLPDVVLLALVGGVAVGIYWLATRQRNSTPRLP
jgi:hypothetical protein